MCRWELLPWISHGSVPLVLYCWFARDVTVATLMVKNKSIFVIWEQNSIFMCIIQEKKSIVLTPNMAAFSCHVVANQEYLANLATFRPSGF